MNCIIMKRGFDHRKNVGNPLINMYVNCGCLNETKLVSDRMILKDDISWGSIARGYVQHEDWQLALEIFRKMISEDIIKLNTFILLSMLKACAFRCFTKMVPEGFSPNKVAFLGALKACTILGDINKGRLLHNQIIQSGIDADIEMSSTLINMYSKCGSLEDTKQVFRGIHSQDGVIWGILSGAYGEWEKAEECLQAIEGEHLEFEAVYGSLISAFGHVGRIEGVHSLFLLGPEYASVPSSIECYNCVADLLGRIGYIKEALILLGVIPMFRDAVGWVSLLTSCKTCGNVKLGKDCLERLMPSNPNLPFGSLSSGVNIHNTKDDMLISKYIYILS